jgi:hypothetical protein
MIGFRRDTGNNSLTKRISYYDNLGFIEQSFSQPAIIIWNCSAETIRNVSSLVEARKHGIWDTSSGVEEFDFEVPFSVEIYEDYYGDGYRGGGIEGDDIPVGGCAVLTVHGADLVAGVNTMLTFTFSYPLSSWIASGNSITIGPFNYD